MHADRTNRTMLLLLALLLIAAGAAAGAASIGAFGTATRHSPLIANPAGHFIGAQGGWLWPAAAVAAAIVVLLALRWLLALLFSTDRAGDLPITPGGSAGRTTLAARALTEAVAEETESYRGVSSARARLLGDPAGPRTRRHRGPGGNRRLRRAAPANRNRSPHPRPLRGRQPIAAHPAGPDRHHQTFHPGRLNRGCPEHHREEGDSTMSAQDKAKNAAEKATGKIKEGLGKAGGAPDLPDCGSL